MKIYFEGTPLFSSSRTGVGHYVKRLSEAMQQLRPENQYTVFGFHFILKGPPSNRYAVSDNFQRKYVRLLPGRAYNLLYKKIVKLPIDVLLGARPDVVIFGNFAYWPLWTGSKSIVVIHDVGYFDVPQYVEERNRRFLQKTVPYSIKKATRVVTISKHAKQRIVEIYGISPDKVHIVNPSVDHRVYYPRSDSEVAAVKKKYGLPIRYFLFLGTLEPRKNLVNLLDAYARLPKDIMKKYPLVLVGGRGWADHEIRERIDRYKSLPIFLPGYIEDDHIPAIICGARALLWPSFYEGFGMPPLEAMACGTPVLTSSTTSLPEVVGDSAVTVNPTSPKDIVEGIIKIANDDELCHKLSEKGIKRSMNFSWEKSAKEFFDVIDSM